MNHIKVWENFENREIKIENGFFHRFKGYTIVHLNGWLNGEQIFDAMEGPFWEEVSQDMGSLYYAIPPNNTKVAYVLSIVFPSKFKRLNLSNLFLQKLADLLGREIRNPQEDEEIMKFSPPKPFTVNFWEYRRDLPFVRQSGTDQVT